MSSLRGYLLGFLVVTVALVGGAALIARTAIDHLLYDDAVSTGRNWTQYLASNVRDIESIAAGEQPSAESRAFFEQAKTVGQVFLYKIYDAQGRVRFASDKPPAGKADEKSLPQHNKEAAEAIERQEPIVEAKEGKPPARPPYFTEAYIPLITGGKVIAVVETYVDQTEKRRQFQATFTVTAAALGLLVAAAFGIPALAWYRRSKEKQLADARIDYLANHDSLTGLPNRNALTEALGRALGSLPVGNTRLAVYSVDLDRFKDVNDALGHDAGDLMLKTAADRLCAIAGPNALVARLGGDEFAIVQGDFGGEHAAKATAKAIIDVLGPPFLLNGQESAVTASVGVAIAPEHGSDVGRLLKSADLALYKSKSGGSGQYRVFTPDLDLEQKERLVLERTIRDALAGDGLDLHFQPQYEALGARLTGFEALIRLPDKDDGFIPPTVFVPIAEKMGVIDRIGEVVLARACRTAAQWPIYLSIAVNLSPAQFAAGNVGPAVERALKESGLEPHRLELEITENLLMSDTEAVMVELKSLKTLGVSIVMDDFGTGYSSLSYLWRFPFDKIKIDRSFMRALADGDESVEKIIRTIVTLGRTLNMKVSVEGVENERQAGFVREIEADEGQGYFYGRPIAAVEVARIIMADYRHRLPIDRVAVPRAVRAASA